MSEVFDLLKSKGLSPQPSGRDYLIKCLNPEHQDRNPSLRVDKLSGIGHCFSCGFSVNIFTYYNIVYSVQNIKIHQIKEKIKKLFMATVGLVVPEEASPFRRKFRGISADTFAKLGAFTVDELDGRDFSNRVIIPVKDSTDKIVAFVGRHALSDANPRYLNYPPDANMPLLPAKPAIRGGTVVLVEGLFDYINLLDKGFEWAVCLFGVGVGKDTKKIPEHLKSKLLELKLQGVRRIIVMFDGDEPGRKASSTIVKLIESEGFLADSIDLEDDKDPGDLTVDEINQIERYIWPE